MSERNVSPTTPINEWACALACIEWYLKEFFICADAINQNQMLEKFADFFPKWRAQAGVCSHMDVVKMLDLLGLKLGRMLYTSDPGEIERELAWFHSKQPVMVFILTTQPTNHCVALGEWIADQKTLRCMNAARPTAQYEPIPLGKALADWRPYFLFVYPAEPRS